MGHKITNKNMKRVLEVARDGKVSTTTVGWTPNVKDEEYTKYKEEEKQRKLDQEEKHEMFKQHRMPWFCPECNSVMNKRLDNKFWRIHNKCMGCVIKEETHMRATGQYDLYEKEKMVLNAISNLKDYKIQFELALEQTNTETFVHESGEVEKWKTIGTLDHLKENIKKDIIKIDESLEQLQSDLEDIIKQKT